MNGENSILKKICGKIQLVNEINNSLDSFYIVQWGDNTGSITLQSFNSLSNYINDVVIFEGKLACQYFSNRHQDNSNQMSNDQAAFIMNKVSQYKNYDNIHVDTPVITEIVSNTSNKSCENNQSNFISTSSLNQNNALEINSFSRKSSIHFDNEFNDYNNMDNDEEIPTLENTCSVFDNDFHNEFYYLMTAEKRSFNSEITNNNLHFNKTNNDFNLLKESDKSLSFAENFVEKNPKSSESWSSVAKQIEILTDCGNFINYQNNWFKYIKEDAEKIGDKINWEDLEIISEINYESKHYFVGYNKESKLMTLIETHQIPESQLYKVTDLQKLYKF
ncbi:Hypothetical protein SRAE_1000008400 [Strongyloides ratti]|uniref:Uncharacterized protein n=1 Tax=Strongyloides ratti TaxID=34506 RepID=A0A090MTW3_STRRB|nr:Hypothetical protein SRAE_1000008400 [Strongyloides ratti]CEF61808.1 Hypothetical protein SRAE_1000008400 [Strongyloides ratti]